MHFNYELLSTNYLKYNNGIFINACAFTKYYLSQGQLVMNVNGSVCLTGGLCLADGADTALVGSGDLRCAPSWLFGPSDSALICLNLFEM